MGPQSQRAEQFVGVEQFGPQNFGQLTFGQAAQHLHLKEAVLRVHIAQRAVHIGFVLGLDVGHPAVVVLHADRCFQAGEGDGAASHGLLLKEIPPSRAQHNGKHQGNQQTGNFQGGFQAMSPTVGMCFSKSIIGQADRAAPAAQPLRTAPSSVAG